MLMVTLSWTPSIENSCCFTCSAAGPLSDGFGDSTPTMDMMIQLRRTDVDIALAEDASAIGQVFQPWSPRDAIESLISLSGRYPGSSRTLESGRKKAFKLFLQVSRKNLRLVLQEWIHIGKIPSRCCMVLRSEMFRHRSDRALAMVEIRQWIEPASNHCMPPGPFLGNPPCGSPADIEAVEHAVSKVLCTWSIKIGEAFF